MCRMSHVSAWSVVMLSMDPPSAIQRVTAFCSCFAYWSCAAASQRPPVQRAPPISSPVRIPRDLMTAASAARSASGSFAYNGCIFSLKVAVRDASSGQAVLGAVSSGNRSGRGAAAVARSSGQSGEYQTSTDGHGAALAASAPSSRCAIAVDATVGRCRAALRAAHWPPQAQAEEVPRRRPARGSSRGEGRWHRDQPRPAPRLR